MSDFRAIATIRTRRQLRQGEGVGAREGAAVAVAPVGEGVGSGSGAGASRWRGEPNGGRKRRMKGSLQCIKVDGASVLQADLHHRIAERIKHHN